MATNHFVLGIFCLALIGRGMQPGGGFLAVAQPASMLRMTAAKVGPNPSLGLNDAELAQRKQIIAIAASQVGVKEATGNNDGVQVESYQRYTGNKKGDAWCASFVSWVFGRAGLREPCSGWSPDLLPTKRLTSVVKPAVVFGIYAAQLGRVAHCGIVSERKQNWLSTIEGNTNGAGSREGHGVYRKLRHVRTVKQYADWIPNAEKRTR
jgi:hypothetical protein